ncbi:SIR2 family NAD-dependent protein deacylase [Ferrovum myxofaciens]|uniref:SIR2 family NAD-dependent protein deacylase n=2 Tax=Ferrovum myxofaciens TaxID=416213 RepID=UPI003EBEB020|nr:SIR2 family protein [Ferrovum myxofaciens]
MPHHLQILPVKTMHELSDLSDYPAIKKLASALHQFDGNQHGAAIMIGAGFSRSAARHVGGEKKMPLWYEFSKKLATELNPNGNDLSFSDPLRIAEEYRAYFGQAALNARIRDEIDDDAWRTGDIYLSLLKLPWSEIMTTNWDTLLERAAKDVHGPYYTTVTKPSDFTWAPSPRIVKLHGTIGTTDTFIAAQEDYRTYPEKFAPFVNFARQVFIENELCLLGFSGDDPNFLHWAGWVRDHLAGHARKIYLVGALKLTAARRKYLESINIAPIDLWDAVKYVDDRDLRHQMATGMFLKAMMDEGNSKVEPHKWTPSNLGSQQVTHDDLIRQRKEPEYAATLLKRELETLQNDRESYPSWLVCPPTLRWRVQNQLSKPYPNAENIAALASDDRAKLLYEIAWRHSITFEYISSWLAEALFQVCNPDEPCGLNKRQQMEIVLVLLKNSCWLVADDEVGKQVIQERVKVLVAMLEKHAQYLPDCAAEIAYHQVLTARDELNYVGMEALVEKIAGEDPVWKLRQAALLMELGRFDDGERLITEAYRELRERYRHNRNSIRILSRLTWAHWLLKAVTQYQTGRTVEALPNFKDWKCDPRDWIENIQEKASKQQEEYLKNKNSIEPSFEQGHYRDNSNKHSTGNDSSEFLLLEGLSRSVGIPLRSGSAFMGTNLLAGSVEKLMLSGGIGVKLWDYTLAIRAASDENSPSIKGVFTRIGVACASKEVVDTLVDRILPVIGYWREKRSKETTNQQRYALSALRVLIEVLARLVVRVLPEKAKEIFRLSVSLGQQRNLQHHWLFDAFNHLLTHSLKSIPESEQGELLADALAFPLQSEMAVNGDFPRFPNPVINHPDERETYPGIERRVGELIEAVTPGGSVSSTAALLRLLPLVEKEGFLTQIERDKLASVLWGSAPTYQVFPNTGLLPHALLLLPTLDAGQVKALVSRHLYEHGEEVLTDTQEKPQSYPSPKIHRAIVIYKGMANAAANETTRLLPTQDQALALFDRLVVWRPQIEQDVFFGAIADSYRKQLIQSISNALSYAIAPVLSNEAKTAERFEQLKAFYEEIEGAFFVIPALVYFSQINEDIATAVKRIIRNALQGRDATEVSYAAIALQKWMGLFEAESSLQLSSLISRLIAIIESGRTVGLQQLLLVAGELFKNKQLSEEQVTTLIDAIQNAFNAANYINIEPNGQEAISASGIREACAKLANTLVSQHPNDLALLGLLKESKTDALPEVRFAIDRN